MVAWGALSVEGSQTDLTTRISALSLVNSLARPVSVGSSSAAERRVGWRWPVAVRMLTVGGSELAGSP